MPAPRPDSAATILHTRNIGDVTVLTDDEGYTLYWFGPDTATKSACQGSCARAWQPVTGPAAWGPGVTGTIGQLPQEVACRWIESIDATITEIANQERAPERAKARWLQRHAPGGIESSLRGETTEEVPV